MVGSDHRGFTDQQAKLKAVWENPHIAGICSQMPNLAYLSARWPQPAT
jgi:hypothetical protein